MIKWQVIIERGSPQGFRLVAEARKLILERENGPMHGLKTEVIDDELVTTKIMPNLQGEKAHVFAPVINFCLV